MLPPVDVKFFRSQGFTPPRALALVRAEQYMIGHGWGWVWDVESNGADCLGDHEEWCEAAAAGECQGHEVLSCLLRDSAGNGLASLGGIIDADAAYARVVVAELAEEAMGRDLEAARAAARPYCKPLGAGLASEPAAVARRLSRLLNALEFEVTGYVAEGKIIDGITVLKRDMIVSLRAEGWRVDYLEVPGKWRVLHGRRAK